MKIKTKISGHSKFVIIMETLKSENCHPSKYKKYSWFCADQVNIECVNSSVYILLSKTKATSSNTNGQWHN
jgi:hypothetical protein